MLETIINKLEERVERLKSIEKYCAERRDYYGAQQWNAAWIECSKIIDLIREVEKELEMME